MKAFIENIRNQLNKPMESSYIEIERELRNWINKSKKKFTRLRDEKYKDLKWELFYLEKEVYALNNGLGNNYRDKVKIILSRLQEIINKSNLLIDGDLSLTEDWKKDIAISVRILELKFSMLNDGFRPVTSVKDSKDISVKQVIKQFFMKIKSFYLFENKELQKISDRINHEINYK